MFHEKRLLADDSHKISLFLFFSKVRKDVAKFLSAAVVIGDCRVKLMGTWRENYFWGARTWYFSNQTIQLQ